MEGVVALAVECHHVVIEESFLLSGLCLPPLEGVADGAAAEVVVNNAVPDPVLGGTSADGFDVRGGIERVAVGLVEGEFDGLRTLGDTVAVHGLDFHGVLSFVAETKTQVVGLISVFLAGHLGA